MFSTFLPTENPPAKHFGSFHTSARFSHCREIPVSSYGSDSLSFSAPETLLACFFQIAHDNISTG
jgi:hypothetical protein